MRLYIQEHQSEFIPAGMDPAVVVAVQPEPASVVVPSPLVLQPESEAATRKSREHERNRRAGTENVPGVAGLGVAARLAAGKLSAEASRVSALRDRLEAGILASVSGTVVNGASDARVPNTTNISFDRVEAESLLIALDLAGVAVSTGSACSSGTLEPSHVLRAMGLPAHRTQNSLRFSLGMFSTEGEVDYTIAVLPRLVEKLRGLTRKSVTA